MNVQKKPLKFIAVLFFFTLASALLAGCEKNASSPSIDIDYLEGQTKLNKTIEQANELANGVQAYYDNSHRECYKIENQTMQLNHGLIDNMNVSSLKNSEGEDYLTDTMDSYIVSDGQTYYASKSPTVGRVNTTQLGYYYYSAYIRDLTFTNEFPLYLEKAYHTYSDRMHQAFRIIAPTESVAVSEFGFETKIPLEALKHIEIFADGKTYTEIECETPFQEVEYVGFDIKGAGIVGYIFAGQETKISITETDSEIILKQYMPLDAVDAGKEILFANRLYTDMTHNFKGLQKANSEEQNPLTEKHISVDEEVDNARFVGYNHMTGCYDFELNGSNFSQAYYFEPERKYYEHIAVTDAPDDRTIFLRVHTTTPMEGAALLDADEKLLPVPLQGCKNFGHEKEEPIYNPLDPLGGDTYMPLTVETGADYDFTIMNVYKLWGNYDIKQLSSIDYYISYYHLSTGVTETNCIAPYYAQTSGDKLDMAWFIPDFRGASGDFWGDLDLKQGDPQHNSVGTVYAPTNNMGGTKANYLSSNIKSAGLIYADLDYSYISDDGNYMYTMRHFELPQLDESRTYYTIDLTFLEDCKIDNQMFSIIAEDGRSGIYNNAAYLDENGKHQEIENPRSQGQSTLYNLNKEGAYFAFYGLPDGLETETGNFGLIVKDYEITVNGKKSDVGLAFLNDIRGSHWGIRNYGSLTLSESVEFKKGDTIHIDLILLPFGLVGQDDCQNVVNVYEDSVKNALAVNAEVGKVMEDTYLPTIKATKNVAEFTLTGGIASNGKGVDYAVKVQGFDKLTNPKVYEKINDEWIEYNYTSELGYDGYSVQIEDNKLSYSFMFTQTDKGRTFKVTAE